MNNTGRIRILAWPLALIPIVFQQAGATVGLTPQTKGITTFGKGSVCDNQGQCSCPCDFTSATCDVNCCCDVQCTNDDILGMFSVSCNDNKDFTRYLNGKGVKLTMCNEKDIKTNKNIVVDRPHQFSLSRLTDFVEEEFQDLLCVRYDNSAVKGVYFNDLELTNKDLIRFVNENDFNTMKKDVLIGSSYEQQIYTVGGFVPVLTMTYNNDKTNQYIAQSTLSLPSSGDGGFCDLNDPVRIGFNVESSCVMSIKDLERECKENLNIDKFVANVKVSSKQGLINTIDDTSDFVDIIGKPFPSEEGTNMSNTAPSTIWDNDNSICLNAITSLRYEIYIDISGAISDVIAYVDSMNIKQGANSLEQDYEVKFFLNSDEQIKVTQQIDYQFSSPILTGTLQEEKILSSMKGLEIMKAGNCQNQQTLMTIRFGENVSVSCKVSLDKSQLEEFCLSTIHPDLIRISDNIAIPKWLYQDQDVVGMMGRADAENHEEWIQITSDLNDPNFVGKSRSWNPLKKECSGIITKLQYHFYWTYVGDIHTPRAKILRVIKEHEEHTPITHSYQDEIKQNFHFATTVSWVYVAPTTNIEHLPLPQLLFSVPSDVFYPFQSRNTAGKRLSISDGTFASLLCVVIVKLFLL